MKLPWGEASPGLSAETHTAGGAKKEWPARGAGRLMMYVRLPGKSSQGPFVAELAHVSVLPLTSTVVLYPGIGVSPCVEGVQALACGTSFIKPEASMHTKSASHACV
jgi:hypothetical protein